MPRLNVNIAVTEPAVPRKESPMPFPVLDPFEAHLRKPFDDADTKTFVRPGEANAEARLADIGDRLADIIAKQNESRRLTAELWRRYLLDCKALGVEPRARPI